MKDEEIWIDEDCLNKRYRDANGTVWQVVNTNNGHLSHIGPVTAISWENSVHTSRIFKRNGCNYESKWDLIEEVKDERTV